MIFEKLDLKFDIEKLRQHLRTVVFPLSPIMQGKTFGGWSVMSSTGRHADGWQYGSYYKEVNGAVVFDAETATATGVRLGEVHDKPTEICTGYLAEVMRRIEELGFHPRRARISLLKANGRSIMHRDGLPGEYAVRLHIPIVTNTGCLFLCDEGTAHFPADGNAYLIRVNRLHQIINEGDEDRYHLMMDVWDIKGVSQEHRFRGYLDNALEVIENRSPRLLEKPFRHVVADDFFNKDFYDALCREFEIRLKMGLSETPTIATFSRFGGKTTYDAYQWMIDPKSGYPLDFFYTQEWRAYASGLFGIRTSEDVSINFHHHRANSKDGVIHSDFNLCSFVDDRLANGVNPWYYQCQYPDSTYYKQPHTKKRMRSIVVIYYLHNAPWHDGDGGETVLCRSEDKNDIEAKIAPINNRLLAFEICPFSYHGFLRNVRSERNSITQWFHQEPAQALRRWRAKPELWEGEERPRPIVDYLYWLQYWQRDMFQKLHDENTAQSGTGGR